MSLPRRLISAIALCAALFGCATPLREQFYTLTPPRSVTAPAAAAIVVIDPITLPADVDRPQLVVSSGEHEVRILEQQRWAAPLQNAIPRVIAARLEAGGYRVVVYPEVAAITPHYRVNLAIQRFESTPGKQALVAARWNVRTVASGLVRSGQRVEIEPVASADYATLVAALSRALARIGDAVTSTIQDVSSQQQ